MDAWAWILIVVAAAVVVVVIAGVVARARRRTQLRDRFGPEYERVALDAEGRPTRRGEAELQRRQARRAELDIRPLPADRQQEYLAQWHEIQAMFVDTPDRSVANAESLVTKVMRERGYPVDADFDQQADLISVDHPQLVRNYRQAHRVYERSLTDTADTEELRNSLVYYRSLFSELLAA
jgi:hypothetical protein